MPLFPPDNDTAMYFSMDDPNQLVSRLANFPFLLDDEVWQSVEHYYQANKFIKPNYQTKIRLAVTSERARKLGQTWLQRKRPDFKQVRATLMTRAVYTQCRTHAELAERLLATGEQDLVESSQYDYFWGCGRDRRGHNQFGQVLMNVRAKLNSERSEAV
ncbi:NADAR family protein [Arenicella xantha]|uniref:NADAR domain-containing protein n=1 Tax=Arenicella xantha TaxID=644221 RepID=A0A395JQA0_9GAMM|nr:NADAR family protein [Arenicella xantha]RBP51758.1 hypothetical protein DFR28_1021191 [Arenicella xantha]